MKKRLLSLFCALLLLVSFSCGVSAIIAVEDETGIRYDTDETEPAAQPGASAIAMKKVLASVSSFWRRFGVASVVVLLVVAVVVAIVISEVERQKKESRPPKPKKKK